MVVTIDIVRHGKRRGRQQPRVAVEHHLDGELRRVAQRRQQRAQAGDDFLDPRPVAHLLPPPDGMGLNSERNLMQEKMPAGGGAVDGEHLAMGESFAAATGSIGSCSVRAYMFMVPPGRTPSAIGRPLRRPVAVEIVPVAASCHQHVDAVTLRGSDQPSRNCGPPAISIETS